MFIYKLALSKTEWISTFIWISKGCGSIKLGLVYYNNITGLVYY